MQTPQHIARCYDAVATRYADKYKDELLHKPFDRALLAAFAEQAKDKGEVIDLGAGPGQTTRFLFDQGITSILGTDVSAEMVALANELHAPVRFEVADMLSLHYEDARFAGALAFYAIVHFNEEQLLQALHQIYRVLKPGASFLLSFHIGDSLLHLDEFLDRRMDIDFYFFDPQRVVALLQEAGFVIVDLVQRKPYATEHATERAYIQAKK